MKRLEVSGAARPLYMSLGVKGLSQRRRPITPSGIEPPPPPPVFEGTHLVCFNFCGK